MIRLGLVAALAASPARAGQLGIASSVLAPGIVPPAMAARIAMAAEAGPSGLHSPGLHSPGAELALPDSLAALEGRPLRKLRIRRLEIFEPLPESRFRPVFALANRLHARTRESTVRDHLLFAPGEPWRERRRAESERALRDLDFLQPLVLRATPAGDSVDAEIVTRDAWTTQPQFNLERGGGKQYGSIGITERNLLGFGKSVDVSYREDPAGITRGFAFSDPALFGTRARLQYSAGSGSAGSFDRVRLALPFWSEEAPESWGVGWQHGNGTGRLYQFGADLATFAQRTSEAEVWYGRGRRLDGTVDRAVASFQWRERRLGESRLAGPAPPEFSGDDETLRLRRFTIEGRRWRPRFIQREGIERLDRVEDWDVGPSVSLQLGFAPALIGSDADEGWVRALAGAGAANRFGFGVARAQLSSRFRREPLELVRQLDARWYETWTRDHLLVLAALYAEGSHVARDFQLVVGGLNGLRAYPVQAVAGHELVRLNAEERWRMPWDFGGMLRFGAAAFYDAARAWGPGADATSWFNAAGIGLRIAPPRSALGPVFRMDVAWPVSPTRDGERNAILSFGSSQAF